MNILYCGDKNIADGLIMSLLSLMHHVKEPLSVYVLTAHISTEEKKYEPLSPETARVLQHLLTHHHRQSKITVINVSKLFCDFPPTANLNTRFTPCCMLRLYADLIEELPDKILYLDNDVICRQSFSEFYHQQIDGYELVGVLDHYGKWFFKNTPLKMDYFNSGVLLLNLKKIRETKLFQKCRERCKSKEMFMPDQSAINKLAKYKKRALRKFNEQRRIKKDTVFHHFTTSFRVFPYFHSVTVKPWQIERMHKVLKLYEYDKLHAEYMNLKSEIQKGDIKNETRDNTRVFQH